MAGLLIILGLGIIVSTILRSQRRAARRRREGDDGSEECRGCRDR